MSYETAVLAVYAGAVVVTFRPREWKDHPAPRSRDVGRWNEG